LNVTGLVIQEFSDGIAFKIKVQPRASRNAVAGMLGDCLKVQLTSPPVEGAANTACIAFFSEILSLPKNRITIISGDKSRNKLLQVSDINKRLFMEIIGKL
jgi:uncharacterized protein (TIGR00251 family)